MRGKLAIQGRERGSMDESEGGGGGGWGGRHGRRVVRRVGGRRRSVSIWVAMKI